MVKTECVCPVRQLKLRDHIYLFLNNIASLGKLLYFPNFVIWKLRTIILQTSLMYNIVLYLDYHFKT